MPKREGKSSENIVWRKWMADFGKHVRRVREFIGFSQEQLAKLSGVSQGAVSRFESGRGLNTPFLVILKLNMALARALRTLDQSVLTDDVQRFLDQMEFFVLPDKAGHPPVIGGTPFEHIRLAAEPEIELLVKRYRELGEGRRPVFLAVMDAVANSLAD
jgi:transcriptional regulator with XRE-family HTH domain